MANNYLLTVAIPTYNGSKTIRQMLDLLLPQINERVEIIVSENASTDDTFEILKSYQTVYPQIKIVKNEVNIGPDANFLQCMRLASGKYTYLISDDDVLIEGQLENILHFLESNEDLSFAYLETVGFQNYYTGVEHCIEYSQKIKKLTESFCTTDKKLFMDYAIRHWGFISSFLWRTELFQKINNPEKYFNSYWLQSYICIECTKDKNAVLGAIKGPVVGAGEYRGTNNFDCSEVDGINYKKMIDFAIENGYCKKQITSFWIWRLCFLGKNAIIQERLSRINRTSKSRLFKLLWKYPYAWFQLFPYFLVPRFIIVMRYKWKHREISNIIKRV